MPEVERLPCLFCDKSFLNADSVIQHCARDHDKKLNTASAVYGNVCPKCGSTFARLPFHSSRQHGRQLALLFADVRREGDTYGVVAGRLREFARQWLEGRGIREP